MSVQIPPELRGLGRGVLGLKSWEPLRKPGPKVSVFEKALSQGKPVRQSVKDSEPVETKSSSSSNNDKSAPDAPAPPRRGNKLLAKAKWNATANSPLGKDELDLKPGEVVTFVQPHPENPYWWEAQNEDGKRGFVPYNYVKVIETQQGLPWLQNKPVVETEEAVFKPYKSAYSKTSDTASSKTDEKQYYCDVCEKQLNGPKPYAAHMASKAHREEVEAQM